VPEPEPRREDLQAALGARRELGPEYEDAVLDSFLERVDKSIEARVDARVAERGGDRGQVARRPSQRGTDTPGWCSASSPWAPRRFVTASGRPAPAQPLLTPVA